MTPFKIGNTEEEKRSIIVVENAKNPIETESQKEKEEEGGEEEIDIKNDINNEIIIKTVQKLVKEKMLYMEQVMYSGLMKKLDEFEEENKKLRLRERVLENRITLLERRKKRKHDDRDNRHINKSYRLTNEVACSLNQLKENDKEQVPSPINSSSIQSPKSSQSNGIPSPSTLINISSESTITSSTIVGCTATTKTTDVATTVSSTIDSAPFIPGLFRSVPTMEVRPYQQNEDEEISNTFFIPKENNQVSKAQSTQSSQIYDLTSPSLSPVNNIETTEKSREKSSKTNNSPHYHINEIPYIGPPNIEIPENHIEYITQIQNHPRPTIIRHAMLQPNSNVHPQNFSTVPRTRMSHQPNHNMRPPFGPPPPPDSPQESIKLAVHQQKLLLRQLSPKSLDRQLHHMAQAEFLKQQQAETLSPRISKKDQRESFRGDEREKHSNFVFPEHPQIRYRSPYPLDRPPLLVKRFPIPKQQYRKQHPRFLHVIRPENMMIRNISPPQYQLRPQEQNKQHMLQQHNQPRQSSPPHPLLQKHQQSLAKNHRPPPPQYHLIPLMPIEQLKPSQPNQDPPPLEKAPPPIEVPMSPPNKESDDGSVCLPNILATITSDASNIILKWNCTEYSKRFLDNVKSYHLFAYQTKDLTRDPPLDIDKWSKIGEIKKLPLPIACSLTNSFDGQNYFFCVMPADKLGNLGEKSNPCALKVAL